MTVKRCRECIFYFRKDSCLANPGFEFSAEYGWVYVRADPRIKNRRGYCSDYSERQVPENFIGHNEVEKD